MRNQKLLCPFSGKLSSQFLQVLYVAMTCWIVEAHATAYANFIFTSNLRERTVNMIL